ncbi:MAG: hypothetical protein ACFB50_06740 [Rubrobacteraceae bacterium]
MGSSKDLRLLMDETTLRKLLVEDGDALLEEEDLCSQLGDDAGGDLLGGHGNTLGVGCSENLTSERIRSLDAAVFEEGGDSLATRPPDLSRSLVVRDEGESAAGTRP